MRKNVYILAGQSHAELLNLGKRGAFMNRYRHLTGGVEPIVVNTAVGGASINPLSDNHNRGNWSETGNLYGASVTAGRNALKAHGLAKISGVVWSQGGADARFFGVNDTPISYRKNLEGIIARYRNDFNQPDLPFIVVRSTMFTNQTIDKKLIQLRLQQSIVESKDPNVYIINEGIRYVHWNLLADHVHFTRAGYDRLAMNIATYLTMPKFMTY